MPRPKIRIQPEPFDYMIELLNALIIICLIVLPAYHFFKLPDSIPSHFDFAGKADNYAGKISIWVMPAIGLFAFAGLSILQRYPQIYNYPFPLTKKNAPYLYRAAKRFLRLLKLIMSLLMLYLVYATIQYAYGETSHFILIATVAFVALTILLSIGLIIVMKNYKPLK